MPHHGPGGSSLALPNVARPLHAVKALALLLLCLGGCGALRLEPADARLAAEADLAMPADARPRKFSKSSEPVAQGRDSSTAEERAAGEAAGEAKAPRPEKKEAERAAGAEKKKRSFWDFLKPRSHAETVRMREKDKKRERQTGQGMKKPKPGVARAQPPSPPAKGPQPQPKKKNPKRSKTAPKLWVRKEDMAIPVVPALIPKYHAAATFSSERVVPKGGCNFPEFGSTEYLEGVQVLPTDTNPASFEKFKHGSGNKEGLFVYPRSNISMCIIEKDGCTSWLTIFNKLTHNKLNIKSAWYGIVPFHWSETNATDVFSNPQSTRIVWVREPLERFLSGFLDKCANFHDFNYYHICGFHWNRTQSPGFPLSQAQAWFRANHTLKELDSHFTPQAWHCELSTRLHEYNVIGLMSKANFSRDAGCILERANLAYLNEKGGDEKGGLPFFTDVQNQGDLEDQNTEILKKFFTKEFALYMMDLYKEDYDLFRIKRPTWVNEATGEWFHMRTAAASLRRSTNLRERTEAPSEDWDADGNEQSGEDLVALAARAGFHLPRRGKVSI